MQDYQYTNGIKAPEAGESHHGNKSSGPENHEGPKNGH